MWSNGTTSGASGSAREGCLPLLPSCTTIVTASTSSVGRRRQERSVMQHRIVRWLVLAVVVVVAGTTSIGAVSGTSKDPTSLIDRRNAVWNKGDTSAVASLSRAERKPDVPRLLNVRRACRYHRADQGRVTSARTTRSAWPRSRCTATTPRPSCRTAQRAKRRAASSRQRTWPCTRSKPARSYGSGTSCPGSQVHSTTRRVKRLVRPV